MTVKVMVHATGPIVMEKTTTGNEMQWSCVILADEIASIQAAFDIKVVPKPQKEMKRQTVLW